MGIFEIQIKDTIEFHIKVIEMENLCEFIYKNPDFR